MSSVLGVTVGESAVRIVRPIDRQTPTAGFQFQVVETGADEPTRLAANTLGVLFQTGVSGDPIDSVGLVYRDEAQADRMRAAMATERIDRFTLVSEAEAAVAYLQVTGELGSNTAVFYDLGDAGLTVTVVDLVAREVLAERTDTIAGRVFDEAIRQHQLGHNGVWRPDDPATDAELSAQCREAKEKLSESDSVAVPGAAGVVFMSRETFDPLISQCVESSAQFVHYVIARAGRNPEAVVLLGGGAHIPLVQEVLRSWLRLPLVVPHEPELVLAKGAAILASRAAATQVPPSALSSILPGTTPPDHSETQQIPVVAGTFDTASADTSDSQEQGSKKRWWAALAGRDPEVSKRQISGAGLAGTALAVVAVIGVGLGAGNGLLGNSGSGENSPTETYAPPTTSTTVPRPQPAVAPSTAPTTTETTPEPAPAPEPYVRPVPEAPAPEPPPPPLIPGLNIPAPQLQLPVIELPPLPEIRIPGL